MRVSDLRLHALDKILTDSLLVLMRAYELEEVGDLLMESGKTLVLVQVMQEAVIHT